MSYYYGWRPYVPVAVRRVQATRKIEKLRKRGREICPVEIEGRTIARSFWGKAWCDHLESFSDYENRLPRGRTYVRNGSVCHLAVKAGLIEAMVSGSSLYNVAVRIKPLRASVWKTIRRECSGRIGSLLELLQGRLSDHVMSVVTSRDQGLLPLPGEIAFECDCPDWATMCKHVAAVLYGVGNRLDSRPEDLFMLRGVDAAELITGDIAVPAGAHAEKKFSDDQLTEIFGIDLDGNGGGAGETPPAITGGGKKSDAGAKRDGRRGKRRAIKEISQAGPRSSRSGGRKAQHVPSAAGRAAGARGRTAKTVEAPSTGEAVAALRRTLGLSVQEFAAMMGVSPAIVYRWEKTPGRLKLQNRSRAALVEAFRMEAKA